MVGQGGRPPSYGADGVSHRLLIKQDPTISSGHSGHMSYDDGEARHAASMGSTSVQGRPEGGKEREEDAIMEGCRNGANGWDEGRTE